jgi:hypothetical protein
LVVGASATRVVRLLLLLRESGNGTEKDSAWFIFVFFDSILPLLV